MDFAALSTDAIAAMSTAQVAQLDYRDTLLALTTAQARALTTAQAVALNGAQVLSLEAEDFAALNTASLAALTASQITALTTEQVVALTTAQARALTTLQLSTLTTSQVAALETGDFASISTGSLAAMLTAQIVALSTAQVAALTNEQAPALTTTEINMLSTSQMQALDINAVTALSTAQVAALSTRGLTALQVSALSVSAKQAYDTYTPIVLDLNGDGISTLAMANGVQFDLLATGKPVQTGWVAPTDGLLVRDLNADGTINNGTELFGNATVLDDGSKATDGYQALAQLDGNYDGMITSDDAVFDQLGVWVDADSDGISDTGEVQKLSSLGITGISVNADVTATLDNGNTIGLTSYYQTADGAQHLAGDVWFAAQDVTTTAGAAALNTTAVAALSTDQLSALTAAPVNAISEPAASETTQEDGTIESTGLAKRSSALADAISAFDVVATPKAVTTTTLNAPADGNGANLRSASLAVGNLVQQMRSFEAQAAQSASGPSSMSNAAASKLASTQAAPLGMIDPLKKPAPNDFLGLSGGDIKKF